MSTQFALLSFINTLLVTREDSKQRRKLRSELVEESLLDALTYLKVCAAIPTAVYIP